MIDYDVYPSFLLTNKASSNLDNTPLNYIYASRYDDFKDAVNVYYNFVNNALKHVINATIEKREIITNGVVKVTYSNGVSIIINYHNYDYDLDANNTIKAKNYLLIGGDN